MSRFARALERRHKGDLFLTEVKDGASQTRSHRRLDGWALLKTWSPVTTIGYEFKESRADWLQDRKWESYLPMVHQFYVCAVKGLVLIEELPASVGLMELVGNDKLVTRRKAARREVEIPTHLLLYVLMARVQPAVESVDRASFWRAWLEKSEQEANLGRHVKGRIRELYQQAETRARMAERKAEDYAHVEEALVKLGLNPERVRHSRWSLERDLPMLLSGIDEYLTHIRHAQEALRQVESALLKSKLTKAAV